MPAIVSVKTDAKRSPMTVDMRIRLEQVFADELFELEALTGRSLSHWQRASEF